MRSSAADSASASASASAWDWQRRDSAARPGRTDKRSRRASASASSGAASNRRGTRRAAHRRDSRTAPFGSDRSCSLHGAPMSAWAVRINLLTFDSSLGHLDKADAAPPLQASLSPC